MREGCGCVGECCIFTRDSIYALALICHANSQLSAGYCHFGWLAVRLSDIDVISKRLSCNEKTSG